MSDIVIIGGGPGGYVAAVRARQLGLTVTLIEQADIGGTCLNRGCIPTKAYYRHAEVLNVVRKAEAFGIQVPSGTINFSLQAAYDRKEKVVGQLMQGIKALLKGNHVEIIQGQATIENAHQVKVNGVLIEAKNILLATGSKNASLPIPGADSPGVLDSTALLELKEVPSSMVIIGGGVISLEFACIFTAFGTEVTVLEYADNFLVGMDREIVKRFSVLLNKQGINVITSANTTAIKPQVESLQIEVHNMKNQKELVFTADKVLIAAGRQACLDGVDVGKLGLQLDKRGFIQVDKHFSTNVPGIYAIGDVIGGAMLAHVASAEGIAAVEHIAGQDGEIEYDAVPACVFTTPEIAAVGLTEEAACERQIAYKTGKFNYLANGKALGMGATEGMVKILADQNDTVIGVHILGVHASDLILEGVLAIREKMKLSALYQTIHPHPTLSEIFYEAALDVNNQAIHKINKKEK